MIEIKAKFDSTCPHCKKAINAGDPIAKPSPNAFHKKKGGHGIFRVWYCTECAKVMQMGEDADYFNGIPFLNHEAEKAYFSREDVTAFLERLAERQDKYVS